MIEIQRRYQLQAQLVANRLPQVFQRRGLDAPFREFLLTKSQGVVVLFAVLEISKVNRLEAYTTPELLHHLSTDLRGLPVLLSNSSGLRYAIPISPLPRLPHRINFPGLEQGRLLIGMRYSGDGVRLSWPKVGHLLVAGKTGSGKSGFLRLLAYQAIAEGARLLISDLDGTTFPMLNQTGILQPDAENPLLAPIALTPQQAQELVERALGECDHRAGLYGQMEGYPDNLEEYNQLAVRRTQNPLPRLLVVLDEFSALVTALGGPRGSFAARVAELGWRGCKFGVHLVFAAQDFTKQVVGRVRDQISAAICFQVRSPEAARAVNCPEAARLPGDRPGLAYTDRWGLVQTFYLDKSLLIEFGPKTLFDDREINLIDHALTESHGRMSIPLLVQWGLSERQARSFVESWELRGWLQKDPRQQNARHITPKLRTLLKDMLKNPVILSNDQAGQTMSYESNPSNWEE